MALVGDVLRACGGADGVAAVGMTEVGWAMSGRSLVAIEEGAASLAIGNGAAWPAAADAMASARAVHADVSLRTEFATWTGEAKQTLWVVPPTAPRHREHPRLKHPECIYEPVFREARE